MKATHKVSFFGVPCYFNSHTGDLWGVNRICDYGIVLAAWLHNVVCFCIPGAGANGFPLKVIKEYEQN